MLNFINIILISFMIVQKTTSFVLQSNATLANMSTTTILSMHELWDGNISVWGSDHIVRKYYPNFSAPIASYYVLTALQGIISGLDGPF